MKKIISLIIAVILILSAFSVTSFAENDNYADYKECIYGGFYNVETEIDLSRYNFEYNDLTTYVNFIFNQHPEIYYIDSISISRDMKTLYVNYTIDKTQVLSERDFIDAKIEPIINDIKSSWDDSLKALRIHDWLVSNFMYDYRLYEQEGKENHDIYGFLRDGKGVCQSYAYTFMYIARKVGLESYIVVSPEKDTDSDGVYDVAGHGWNVVKINGNWYHVDATYDDPILGQSFKYDLVGEVSHAKFMLSDTEVETDLNHTEFYIPGVEEEIVCNAYEGANLWKYATSSVQEINGYWYYLDRRAEAGGLMRTKDFVTAERIKEIGYLYAEKNSYWWEVGSSLHDGYFTGIFEYNEHLFFSDSDKIYVYDTHHEVIKELDITLPENNHYFGLNMKGRTITYITSQSSIEQNVVQGSYTLDGHTYITDWETVKEPTDTDSGLKIKRCYICGETVQRQTIPSLSFIKLGDIDGDNTVGINDLATLKLYLAGALNLETKGELSADLDGSGKVEIADLAKLKLYLAGAINQL
ncbi:MAG: hypothetical protein E7568_06850 [Ruminococcaceae bacterium]|nr:hypothetical protein [Oscillospiraceae bacterium]